MCQPRSAWTRDEGKGNKSRLHRAPCEGNSDEPDERRAPNCDWGVDRTSRNSPTWKVAKITPPSLFSNKHVHYCSRTLVRGSHPCDAMRRGSCVVW